MAPFDLKSAQNLSQAVPRPEQKSRPCSACAVRGLTVCAPLDASELDEVQAIVSKVRLGAGEPIIDEGEDAIHVFNVTSGTAKVYKLLPDGRRQVIGFLIPGDFLGLANDSTYAYSAESVTAVELCRFPRGKLENLLADIPSLERRMLSMVSHELAVAQEQMLLLGRKTATEKIASFLLSYSRRLKDHGLADNPLILPMSRNDIGDYLGLTTETVSRTFTALKREGLIRLEVGGRVAIPEWQRLKEVAEGN